jgi:hypothetical protein
MSFVPRGILCGGGEVLPVDGWPIQLGKPCGGAAIGLYRNRENGDKSHQNTVPMRITGLNLSSGRISP